MHANRALTAALIMVVLLAGVPAFAAFPATDTFVASVGRGAGMAGSQW